MSNTKFTPGPWFVCNETDVFTGIGAQNAQVVKSSLSDGWQIADCSQGLTFVESGEEAALSHDEDKANAALIAAAPDLYGALEKMLAISGGVEQGSSVYEFAVAALTKARGE